MGAAGPLKTNVKTLYGIASNMKELRIREYDHPDERGWLQCRVLAFLETAFFDDVRTEKETYQSDSIELVAECDGMIVGLIDIEIEKADANHSGIIWHVAVHPNYQRSGIATNLLKEASARANAFQLTRLEAWTRDDDFVNDWYRSQGFKLIDSYYHIYANHNEVKDRSMFSWPSKDAYTMSAFIHYLGSDQKFISEFKRVHECRRYDLALDN